MATLKLSILLALLGVACAVSKEPLPDPARPRASTPGVSQATAADAVDPGTEARARVAKAAARVADLEQRLATLRNPALPRPIGSPEETEAWTGLTQNERGTRIATELDQAREELAAAKEHLAQLGVR